jgi:hypothetical protein
MYSNQRKRAKRRKHPMPTYTADEFEEAILAMPLFHTLHSDWVLSGYNKQLVPSIDRLDDDISYTEDNIQLVTWKENNEKHYADRKNGTNNKLNKAVLQLTKEGTHIAEHYSVSEASRVTKINRTGILNCISGKAKSAGNCIWRYK